jgi:hypothetical protein
MTVVSMQIDPLPPEGRADLDERRRWVAGSLAPVSTTFGLDADELTAGIARIAAGASTAGQLGPADRWAWLSLGVALGDVFCLDNPGAQWVQVTDSFGTDPVVQLQPGRQLIVGAPTMLAKRVEAGEAVDENTLAGLRDQVRRTAQDAAADPE